MKEEKEILNEIKKLRTLISRVIGSHDLPQKEKFSLEAINKASIEFQKLSIQRGEWIQDSDIDKHIKNAPYRAGKFIIEEFGFSNYFKRGHTYYFNKKDIIDLAQALKKRNVDLKRYIELKEDQVKFEKYVASVFSDKDQKVLRSRFSIPKDAENITTSPPKLPDLIVLRNAQQELKEEFFENKFSDYIDIYRESYAHMKNIYYFEKYLDPKLRKRIIKWTSDFNLVNQIIEEITKKKEKFIPISDDKIIQL